MRQPGDDTEELHGLSEHQLELAAKAGLTPAEYAAEIAPILAEIDGPKPNVKPPDILRAAGSQGPRYPTGIEGLDEKLTPASDPLKVGLPMGRLVCLNGAPHAGKSLMLGQLCLKMARHGLRVVMLVDDEPREDCAERIGQGLGFMHKELNADYPGVLDSLNAKMAQEGIDLTIVPDEETQGRITIEQAGAILQSVNNEKGLVLGIDSLHTAICDEETDEDAPRLRIEKRMAALRILRRAGVLVIFTGEANRGSYASKDPAARTSALAAGAESRAIEFGADIVILLTEGEAKSIRIEVPKNRVGRKRGHFNAMLDAGAATLRTIDQETLEATAKAMREEALLPLEDKIVDLVRAKGWKSSKDLSEELGARKENVTLAVKHATEKGKLATRKHRGQGGGLEYGAPGAVGQEGAE